MQYPFSTREELTTTDYNLRFMLGSAFYSLMQNAEEGTTFHKMWTTVSFNILQETLIDKMVISEHPSRLCRRESLFSRGLRAEHLRFGLTGNNNPPEV